MLWAGFLSVAALSVGAGAVEKVASRACFHHHNNGGTIYDFHSPDLHDSQNITMDSFRGKVVLIVNVATYCGYTNQYHDMNVLHNSFSDFQVIGVPCNQFGKQEPAGSGKELEHGIKHVRPGNGFVPDFILLKKTDVNGVNELPLFTYLKEYCPPTRDEFADPSQLFYHPMKSNDIRWNWEKFLITKSGKPYMRYDADTRPDAIKNDVAFLLQQEF